MENKKYNRFIVKNIESWLYKNKVIIIYGPRRVGKTTISKYLNDKFGTQTSYINCDILEVQKKLQVLDPISLRSFLGDGKFFILDEAQNVPNIGQTLKLLIDTYPEIQIIATGSSSFDLVNKLGEPLTGRSITFYLYPLSILETIEGLRAESIANKIEESMIYGSYPEIVSSESLINKKILLQEVVNSYLYKDILTYDGIKKPALVVDILKMLALQIGNEVSFNEIATALGVARATIERYIDILEKVFIIKSISAYNKNLRNEISKKKKYYFYDLGIRNTLINNFNDLSERNDVGYIWENYAVMERLKFIKNNNMFYTTYFWRNQLGAEIDYIEESGGELYCYEFKYNKKLSKIPIAFDKEYKPSKFIIINRDNLIDEFLK